MAKSKRPNDESLPEPKGMRARLERREREQEAKQQIVSQAASISELEAVIAEEDRRIARKTAKPGLTYAFSRVFGWLFSPFRACLLSGLLIGLSFQPHDIPGLILVALVPLFLALPRFKKTFSAFLGCYACGLIAFMMVLRYLAEMEAADGNQNMIWVAYIGSCAMAAINFGFLGLTLRWVQRRLPRALWLLLVPVVWTGFEFWRFHFPAPFSPMLAGYALAEFDVLIQSADLGSVLMVSLFVAVVNACIAVYMDADLRLQRAGRNLALLLLVLACGSNYAYGVMRLEEIATQGDLREDGPVVSIIQPNLTQKEKHLGSNDQRWLRHWQLTQEALPDRQAITSASDKNGEESDAPLTKPDVIIWSETSVPHPKHGYFPDQLDRYPIHPLRPSAHSSAFAPRNPEDYPELNGRKVIWPTYDPRRIALDTGVPIIFGTHAELTDAERQEHYPWLDEEYVQKVSFNRAYYIDKEGKVAGIHDKARLVPFGEYIPFQDTEIGQEVADIAAQSLGYEPKIMPGYRRDTFEIKDSNGKPFRFSMNICYEYFFPDIYQELHKNEHVHFTVTLSNEAWYFDSTELDQAMVMSKFRAIETRTTFVRATNSGISAIIGPDGKEYARLTGTNAEGEESDRLIKGVLTSTLPYLDAPVRSYFLLHGMWLGWGTGLAAAGLMVLGFLLSVLGFAFRKITGKQPRDEEAEARQSAERRSKLEAIKAQERARLQQEALKRRAQEAQAHAAAQAAIPGASTATESGQDQSAAKPQGDQAAANKPQTPPKPDQSKGGKA